MTQSVSIFGLGYVGIVTAACFASLGHSVIGVDVNQERLAMLNAGKCPIVEAGLNELIAAAVSAGSFSATNDATAAVLGSDISFISVGTPSLQNGQLDLQHIRNVATQIGIALRTKRTSHIVVLRSTILPGTTEDVVLPILEKESGKRHSNGFTVCYNPEFLREGSALDDFMNPPYIVAGARSAPDLEPLRELYRRIPSEFHATSIATAEMAKYFSNCYHALKVGFANEMGTLCKFMGVDAQTVTKIFTSDLKLSISAAYLNPGFAFGGSCLPKDLRAVTYKGKELDLDLPLLNALMRSNEAHINRAVDMVLRTGKEKIAVLGLTFKAGTDDIRESPQVLLLKRLIGEGLKVTVWDEETALTSIVGVEISKNLQRVLADAEVVILSNKAAGRELLDTVLKPDQIVIDLVYLDAALRPRNVKLYEGICW